MAAKILLFIEMPLERLVKKHPLLLMIIMPIAAALSMIIIVSAIMETGGRKHSASSGFHSWGRYKTIIVQILY